MNIAPEKLKNIADSTSELVGVINEGVQWVDTYLKDDERLDTNYELKKYRRYLKNIKNVITKKTVISLFGKSQVGKSYLVDSILSTSTEKDLMIPSYMENKEYRFIGDLNPTGGKESTGVVSRFSIEKNIHLNTLPIEIKLITPKDIILILCDSYYSDIKFYISEINTSEIINFLSNLNSLFSNNSQYFLDEDDIFDIKDYLEKYFKEKDVLLNFNDAKFWDKIANSISKIAPEKWYLIFELLWGKNKKLSDLFSLLIKELQSLDFTSIVHTEFDSLLISHGSILDVQRLFELESDTYKPVKIEISSGKFKSTLRSRLAALTYEVTIPVKENLALEKEFLTNVDILDFPGARAREMYDEKILSSLDNTDFFNFYRRGKVAYLFNRYTENYEISSLLFCIDHEQLEVKNLPTLLNNWINNYIGSNINERTNTLKSFSNNTHVDPLLIIFTKANLILQRKPKDDNDINAQNYDYKEYDYKWITRFKSIFVDEYCKGFDWQDNWILHHGGVEKFKNLYLLRAYKFHEDIYEGFKDAGKETAIKSDRVKYMEGLKQSFMNLDFNKEHFADLEKSWTEFSDLNKDGSEYIIKNITPLSTNEIRTTRYINLLNQFKIDAESELKKQYHSNQSDAQIINAAQDGSTLQSFMNKVFGIDAYYFGSFIEKLTISEKEIYKFYHEILQDIVVVEKQGTNEYTLIRASHPDLSFEKTYEENLEVLRRDDHRASIKDTEEHYSKTLGIDLKDLFEGDLHSLKNKSEQLSERARDYWFETKLNVNNYQFYIDLGLDKKYLNKLFDSFKTNYTDLKLTKYIAEQIREFVDTTNKIVEAEDMIAHITAGIINEFVNSVGWTYYPSSKREKLVETNKLNNLNLNIPNESEVFKSLNSKSVEILFDYMEKLNENLSKIPIDREAIVNVPMIKNYLRWCELMKISFVANCDIPTYNVEANKKLGDILEKMKIYNFSV